MKAATITITIILITMMRKERVMSDDKLIYFHKYDHHDGKELPEGLFHGHHHDGDCDCGCGHDHDVDGFHAQIMGSTEPGLFSEDSFDPDEVDNVVLTLYNECVDELLAISDLVDKGNWRRPCAGPQTDGNAQGILFGGRRS